MDATTSSTETSSAAASTLTAVVKQRGKISWPEASSIQQNFSLPSSIMYYMAKNPATPEGYLKMAQSCKFFFEKLPILVIHNIHCYKENTRICSKSDIECFESNEECCVKTDLNKISSQIWLTGSLCVRDSLPNYISTLCQKIYRCEMDYLEFQSETIMFDDFKLLASAATTVHLHECLIKSDDGKPTMLEKIVESIPKMEELQYTFGDDKSMITAATMGNIMKLQNVENLKMFVLAEVPEACPVGDISALYKKFKTAHVVLYFADDSLSEAYMNQLDTVIDEIIASEVPNHIIDYEGQDIKKYNIMYGLHLQTFDDDSDEEEDNGHDGENVE